jgi:hypothetical protein
MKIRGDWVTNSSTASFILTLKPDVVDAWANYYRGDCMGQLLRFLGEQASAKGELVEMAGQAYLALPIRFHWLADVAFPEGCLESDHAEADLSGYSDEEMWAFVYWIIASGQMDRLMVVGATMTDSDHTQQIKAEPAP